MTRCTVHSHTLEVQDITLLHHADCGSYMDITTLHMYITLQRLLYGHYNGVSVRVSVATLQVWWRQNSSTHFYHEYVCTYCTYCTCCSKFLQLCRSLFFVGALFAQVHAQDLQTCILRPRSLCLCF